MNDDSITNFKIRLDDENPDDVLKDTVEKEKKTPSGRKIWLLFLSLLILTAVGLAVVYVDIKKRMATNIDASTTVVANISKEVSTAMTEITARQDELDKTIKNTASSLSTSISDINTRLKKIESSINSIQKSKSDKTELSAAVADVEKKLTPVQTSLEEIHEEMAAVSENLKKEVSGVRNEITSQLKKFEAVSKEVAVLSVDKVDKKTLEATLQKEKDRHADTLNKLIKEVEFIRYKIKIIEERLPAPLSGSEQPSSLTPGPKAGGISEQTIE